MNEKSKFSYLKFDRELYNILDKMLSREEAGRVIMSAMSILLDGNDEKPIFNNERCDCAFIVLMEKINASRKAYTKR